MNGYWRHARGTHEYLYYVGGKEQLEADISAYAINLSDGSDGWHAYFWDRPGGPAKSWELTISFDLIPAHAIEEAQAWAIAIWRMQ